MLILNDRISLISNRGLRAPRILNFMQGLDVDNIYPLSPFAKAIARFEYQRK